jgi:copper chaperone CopZ
MKTLFSAIFLLSTTLTFSQIKKAELVATGLTCSMCSNSINKAFKTMPEVESVDIELNKNLFVITLKKGNKLTPKAFKDKVEKAGFFIGSLILTMPFENTTAANNTTVDVQNTNYTFVETTSQTIQGDKKVKVLDKGFVTAKEYKTLSKSFSKYPSYTANNLNKFHIKLL